MARQTNERHSAPSEHLVTLAKAQSSAGGAYFDREVAEDKTKQEAVRSLKRQISNALYRQLVITPRGSWKDTRKRLVAIVVGSSGS